MHVNLLGNDGSACHVQVDWANQEVPFVSHYAGCTVRASPNLCLTCSAQHSRVARFSQMPFCSSCS